MAVRRFLPILLLACSLGLTSVLAAGSAPPAGGEDYSQAIITGTYPPVVKVSKGTDSVQITLRGKNLLTRGLGDVWNVREVFVYVRRAGTNEAWRGLYNNRRDMYPNFPLENGYCEYHTGEYFLLSLPKPLYCASEGSIEIEVVKGKWDGATGDLLVQVQSTSAPFKVPVSFYINAPGAYAKDTNPKYYLVGQAAPPPLMVYGTFGPGSIVEVDNTPLIMQSQDFAPGWITSSLPPGFLDKPGQHTVTIRDQQSSPCVPTKIWVYGPPVIKQVAPPGLIVGGNQANIELTYEGLPPDKAEVKVGYVYNLAPAAGQSTPAQPVNASAIPAKADPKAPAAPARVVPLGKTSGTAQATAAKADPDAAPKEWTDIAFGTHGGNVQIGIPASWLKQEGTVKVRLTGKAGSVEASIPIKRPVTLSPVNAPVKTVTKAIKK
jgi:hypothetical protein